MSAPRHNRPPTMELYNAYYEWAGNVGDSILKLAQPDVVPTPPTQDWAFTHFGTALAISTAYLAFVFFGSAVMRTQKSGFAEALYPVRFAYNVSQMMLCSYMAIEAFTVAYREGYPVVCANFVYGEKAPMAKVLWLFYVSKILDFMDTFFIVTGKKWTQLSFLHVYHHTTIFLFYWLNVHVNYDGDVYLTIILNGLIHTLMYTYYFVSLHTRDIWWKSFLTSGQMVQFCCMISQASYMAVTGCSKSPTRVTLVYCVYIMSLLFLFAQFFTKTYVTKPKGSGGKKRQ